jgi:hypothetical protein
VVLQGAQSDHRLFVAKDGHHHVDGLRRHNVFDSPVNERFADVEEQHGGAIRAQNLAG